MTQFLRISMNVLIEKKLKKFFLTLFFLLLLPLNAFAAHLSDGWYQILSAASPGRCLEAEAGVLRQGNKIVLANNKGTLTQRFYLCNVGNDCFILQSSRSLLVLDVEGFVARNGAEIMLWPDAGSRSQMWKAVPGSGDYFFIESALREGTGLDSRGSTVQLWDLGRNNLRQQWIFKRLG